MSGQGVTTDNVDDNLGAYEDDHHQYECNISRFESRREKMKNIRGKSVKKSRDWIQEKKVM